MMSSWRLIAKGSRRVVPVSERGKRWRKIRKTGWRDFHKSLSLYGLKQSTNMSNLKATAICRESGLNSGNVEKCLYSKAEEDGRMTYIRLYANGFLVTQRLRWSNEQTTDQALSNKRLNRNWAPDELGDAIPNIYRWRNDETIPPKTPIKFSTWIHIRQVTGNRLAVMTWCRMMRTGDVMAQTAFYRHECPSVDFYQ